MKALEMLRGSFGAPQLLLVTAVSAALLPLLLHFLSRRDRARRQLLVDPALAQRAHLLPVSPIGGIVLVLSLLALLGVGAALARPRWGDRLEKAERRGADVVLLLDTSASMRATDVSPSRLPGAPGGRLAARTSLGRSRRARRL